MSAGLRGLGRRGEVQDPLAFNPREQSPDRSVSVPGVRNPGQSGGTGNATNANALLQSLGSLQGVVTSILDERKDEAITEGKVQFMQGKTLQEVQAAGNNYTVQGYQTLNAADQANKWFAQEQIALQNEHYDKDPAQYAEYLKERRKAAMDNLPDDPAVRKVFVAAYDDLGPRLASAHVKANSEHKERETTNAFTNYLGSLSGSSTSATKRASGGVLSTLRVSAEVIDKPINSSAKDRDIGIRTIIGEAGGEGEVGQAAVAHVLKNRAGDSRWGGSIASVALAPKQFSAWNKGAGGVSVVHNITPDSPAYKKAGEIYDAVMAGKTVDPTNGATHYYSPKGMQALVSEGSQKNLVPSWADQEAAKGTVRIGNHIFSGKAGTSSAPVATARFGLGGIEAGTENQAAPGAVPNGVDVAVAPGADPRDVATTAGVTPGDTPRSTAVREAIMGWNGLKGPKKAAAVADAMRRQLAQGDDTLFNDAGGVQVLRDLGANASDVDEVIKAKRGFDKEQMNHYNAETEKERATLLAGAKSGKMTEDDVILSVAQMRERQIMNDADARSLVREAVKIVQDYKGDSQKLNLDLRDSLADLYTGVRTGAVDKREAGEKIKALGEQYDVPSKELEGYVSKVYELDQSRLARLESEGRALASKAADEQVTKDLVAVALKKGYGLTEVQGSVTVQDKDTGADIQISAKQYGVRVLEDGIKADIGNRVKSGELRPEMAGPTFEKIKFAALAKQNVVDEEFAAQLRGALTGDIIDAKTKLPSEGAQAAFDMYLRLANDPAVGDAYLSQYLSSENRSLVQTAKVMYDGRLNISDALVKAQATLSNPVRDADDRIKKDIVFEKHTATAIDKAISENIGTDSWIRYFMGSVSFSPKEQAELKANAGPMRNFIYSRASAYHMQFPNQPAEVSVRMAGEDAARNFVPVKGGMVYGDSEKGLGLDQVMGVQGYGRDKPSQIIDEFVREQGPLFWKGLYEKRRSGTETFNAIQPYTPFNLGVFSNDYGSRFGQTDTPAYGVQYLPDQKMLGITLYDSADKKTPKGPVMWVRADGLGKKFVEKDSTPSAVANVWDTVTRGVAGQLYGRGVNFATQGYSKEEIDSGEGFLSRKRREAGRE